MRPLPRAQVAETGLIVALSGRNRCAGSWKKCGWTASGQLRCESRPDPTAVIGDAIQIQLKRGDDAIAIIKSTDVMIAPSDAPVSRRSKSSAEL